MPRTTRTVPDIEPWYKQGWPWLLISLPASAVVGGIITIFLAVNSPNALVVDDYYKEGLAINEDLARARRATELGITAELTYDARTGVVVLATTGVPDETRQLTLRFVHPTLAERDVTALVVRAADGRYRTQLAPLAAANWHVQLQPDAADWRLETRLALPGSGQASLR